MAEEAFPFQELAEGDRTVSAAMFAKQLRMHRTPGVVAGLDGDLAVTASSPPALSVDLDAGAAFVGLTELRAYRHTLPRTLSAPPADPTNPRHDIVALELATSTSPDTRHVRALIIQGSASATPVDPPLLQTEALYQLPLARIVIPAAAASLTAADLSDLRPYSQPVTGPGFDVPLPGLVDHIRDSTALLCFSDFTGAVLHNVSFDLGMSAFLVNSGAVITAISGLGGAVALRTGTSTNSSVVTGSLGRQSVSPARDPRLACRLKSSPSGSGLAVQGWGLISTTSPTNWTSVIWRKAMFRSSGAGALFAVTGDGVAEQTTDLTAFHTLASEALFEIRSRDSGAAWDFLIDGAIVATHTTTVPVNAMYPLAGLLNNTTTDFRIDSLDFFSCIQDRA